MTGVTDAIDSMENGVDSIHDEFTAAAGSGDLQGAILIAKPVFVFVRHLFFLPKKFRDMLWNIFELASGETVEMPAAKKTAPKKSAAAKKAAKNATGDQA